MAETDIVVWDGPNKGLTFFREEADLIEYSPYDMKTLVEDDGEIDVVDEPYYLVRNAGGGWALMSWEEFQKVVRSRDPEDPDEMKLRASHGARGGELLTIPCKPGQHAWPKWEPTPSGNRTRRCPNCQVSQFKLW